MTRKTALQNARQASDEAPTAKPFGFWADFSAKWVFRQSRSAKHMRALFFAFTALFLLRMAYSEEPVFLRDTQQTPTTAEGIFLFIAADGSFYTESGPTTLNGLRKTFRTWRASGTEPGIRVNLFPIMKSNSNLRKIKSVLDFLRSEKIQYDIMIHPSDATPEPLLE